MKTRREKPSSGLVVRFDYLWKREASTGQVEGRKDRPCAVVIPMPVGADGRLRVILAAVTHSAPPNPLDAIEIPAFAKNAIGLDDQPSWIVVSEVNIVDWNDAGFVPATRDRWSYGHLPKNLVNKIRTEILNRANSKTLTGVRRD